MDSSRSGLLSTLIMTVPLIVVPAIALLRPAGPNQGLSTNQLEASDTDDFFNEEFGGFGTDDFDNDRLKPDISQAPEGSEDYSELFAESNKAGSASSASGLASAGASGFADPFAVSEPSPQESSPPETDQQLNSEERGLGDRQG